ncbi:MupA/Atu3671 family FMN-dependent luciferase-like monooxygenase [Sulfitobacter aestuariivivens]
MIAGGHAIVAVVTRDEAVRDWAADRKLRVFAAPGDLPGAGVQADWLLSIANLRIIPDAVLAIPAKGAINFHDGPLPRYAGLNTPAWAIINGETTHGVSWHLIEGGVDEGDLLAQKLVEVSPDETAFSLNAKCYAAGLESFAGVLAQLEAGTLNRRPQDLSQRSYFARDDRPAHMGVLDFDHEAEVLSALVRGLEFGGYWNPLGIAKVQAGDKLFHLSGLELSAAASGEPGLIIEVTADAVTVGTRTSDVILRGVTDLGGTAVDLTTIFTVGETLPCPDIAALPVSDEARWRGALRQDMLALPLLKASDRAPATLTLPIDINGLKLEAQAVAAALVLCRSADPEAGCRIALAKVTDHPLAADTVPLLLPEGPLDTVLAGMGKAIDAANASAGMARDLPLRDPLINAGAVECAISLDGSIPQEAAITVALAENGAALHYDAARLTLSAAKLLQVRLNAAFAAYPNAKTRDDIAALPQTEEHMLRETWNDTQRGYERVTIHAAFEAQVAATPDAVALVFENQSLSYAQLNARANRVAHTLRGMGAGPDTPIGLYTARGIDLLVATLGILKAGGAYVPLDPAYPADRIAHYIADSDAPIIVTQAALRAHLPPHAAEVLEIDSDPRCAQAPETNPEPSAGMDDLAYLIYTSGSTGTPKGVMVTHGNVANFFAGMDDRIDFEAGAVWLAVTSLSFDISVLELFWTLSRGFKLVLAGDESRTMMSNGPVTSDRAIDFNLFYWGNDDGVGPKKYELLLEGAKFADAHGFNAVWTPERHFHAFGGPYPNPSVTGAAVAAVTQNLDIRAGSCVAPLHHPARIAEEWAVIDNLTNGRVGLAIASGWQPDDFVLRPENTPPENKPAMYATIDQLRQLWAGEAVAFPKKDGTPHAVLTQPRPVSKELPIWVTTAGNPQTWKEAGEIGANVLTHLLGQTVEEVAGKIEIYHAALREAGHDPADFKVTVMLHTYLAGTREEAEEIARAPMKDYLRSAAGLIKQYAWAFPAFKKPHGATNPFEIDLEGLSAEEMDAILEFAFQRYFNDSGLFGTIDDGVARTEELKAIGVDEVACLIDYGIAPDVVMEGLKPLAEVLRLANEGAVVAQDDFSLAAQLIRHDVTHLQCTPSMAQMLVTNDDARRALGGLSHLMVGGESLPGSLVAAMRDATQAQIHNMYGPTETTIWSTTQPVMKTPAATAPLGTPIANTKVFILDEKKSLQPVGVAGELWIGGAGVTRGYWRRETLTAERYIDNPYGPGRLYQTGDLAAWGADGTLHFMGRADAQVKIRGHRIELGEIEACLSALPGVTQAVVIARDAPGGAQLVGYVTASTAFDPDAARRALAADLPAIMVPTAIIRLDAMPLTPNKKINRKALPAPQVARPVRAAPKVQAAAEDAPQAREETRARISEIWQGILGVADIQGDDNFFDLGGIRCWLCRRIVTSRRRWARRNCRSRISSAFRS